MKKIFLFIILLSVYSFSQENRTVRMNNLTDSLNTVRNSLSLKLNKSDSTLYATQYDLTQIEGGSFDTTYIYQALNLAVAGLNDDIAEKAPTESPTFTGTVTLPVGTSIGNASSTNIQYLSGLSGNIMTLLNSKLNTAGGTINSLSVVNDFKPYEAGVPTLGTQSFYWKELWAKTWKYHIGTFTAQIDFPTYIANDITITLPNKTGTFMVDSDTLGLSNRIDLKAPIANPVFTGTPMISTDTIATRSYVREFGGTGNSAVDTGYYVAKIEMFSGDAVPMTINPQDSGDVLIIIVRGFHPNGTIPNPAMELQLLYDGNVILTAYSGFDADQKALYDENITAYVTVDDTDAVDFGIYSATTDPAYWLSYQTATVITLKKGSAGGGSGSWGSITGSLGDQSDLITVLDSLGAGWASKLNASDTLSLSNRINLKLSTADFPTALTNHFFSGQDSLHYGVDSIVITHGVGDTPLAKNISITLNSNGFGYSIWVNPSTITSTTFTVRRNDVPTELPTDAIKFNWMIRKE